MDLRGEEARWFDRWLKPAENDAVDEEQPNTPVRIFVMGSNVWRDEQAWPLPETRWTSYYLASGGSADRRFGDGALSLEAPSPVAQSDTYTYDPRRPTPFITKPTSSQMAARMTMPPLRDETTCSSMPPNRLPTIRRSPVRYA